MNSEQIFATDAFNYITKYYMKEEHMHGLENTFILIEANGYGQKVAIPFSTEIVKALTNAVILDNTYNSSTGDYSMYLTEKKLNIGLARIDRFEKAPVSEQEEIKALEEERAKLFKAAEELNQQINAKSNK
jgi:hypothetical protein